MHKQKCPLGFHPNQFLTSIDSWTLLHGLIFSSANWNKVLEKNNVFRFQLFCCLFLANLKTDREIQRLIEVVSEISSFYPCDHYSSAHMQNYLKKTAAAMQLAWIFLPVSQIQKTEEISTGSEILVVKERLAFAFPSLYLTMCTFIYACVFICCSQMLSCPSGFQIWEATSLIWYFYKLFFFCLKLSWDFSVSQNW